MFHTGLQLQLTYTLQCALFFVGMRLKTTEREIKKKITLITNFARSDLLGHAGRPITLKR